MGRERREADRHSVFAGNAEVLNVFGRGRQPGERARIVNWSRGGLLLKVPSPRRKMLFLKQEPVLFEDDTLDLVVRLAPAYNDIPVRAEVRHAVPDRDDPNHLLVGIAFEAEEDGDQAREKMARILEPKSRSGRLKKVSSRQSRVTSRLGKVESGKSGRASRKSERASRKSGRTPRESERTSRKSRRLSTSSTSERGLGEPDTSRTHSGSTSERRGARL